jgi:putative spermidine/putrescine transport system substrate-binding protein
MSRAEKTKRTGVSRRTVLKGAAAASGLAAGSSIGGFPTIWAQNIKDIVLRHAGPPVTAIPRIAEQATKVASSLFRVGDLTAAA